MRTSVALALVLMVVAGAVPADAQIWPLRSYSSSSHKAAPAPVNPQADLIANTGSDTVYFTRRSITLDPASTRVLATEARWLIANPTVTERIEGHADQQDTRSYAVAIGAERAAAVRDFLVLQGVAPDRLKVTSWGKERPGTIQNGPTTVSVGARVVTVVSASSSPAPLGNR